MKRQIKYVLLVSVVCFLFVSGCGSSNSSSTSSVKTEASVKTQTATIEKPQSQIGVPMTIGDAAITVVSITNPQTVSNALPSTGKQFVLLDMELQNNKTKSVGAGSQAINAQSFSYYLEDNTGELYSFPGVNVYPPLISSTDDFIYASAPVGSKAGGLLLAEIPISSKSVALRVVSVKSRSSSAANPDLRIKF